MRRITLALVATVAGLVLLLSYRTSLSGPATNSAAGQAGAPPGIVRQSTPAPSTSDSAAPPTAGTSGDLTVNGSLQDNGFGPIQVQIQVSGGRIVDVVALAQPGDGHSRRINSYALPQLREEVLAAQSAHIDAVSGATVTSEAYVKSLQAAIDAAHLGS
jgi:uncharacterized protein with FMN-binding domain